MQISLAAVCNGDESDERMDDAIALAVICFGGIALARAVPDDEFSARVLRVAREAAATYADHTPTAATDADNARHRGS